MKWIVTLVLLMATVAGAQDLTCFFGKEFAGVEVSKRFDHVEIGGVFAVDYFLDTSDMSDLDLDIGDNYEGLSVKLHALEEDSTIDPFIGYTPLVRQGDFDKVYHIMEAGVMVNLTDSFGVGVSYIHGDDMVKDDQWMVRLRPIRFK